MDFGFEEENTEYRGYSNGGLMVSSYGRLGLNDYDDNDIVFGEPELTVFDNSDRTTKAGKPMSFDNLRFRLADHDACEYVQHYIPIPRMDNGFVKNIHKDNRFYNQIYVFITSALDALNQPRKDYNTIKRFNLEGLIKYINENVNYMEIKVLATDTEYKAFEISKIRR